MKAEIRLVFYEESFFFYSPAQMISRGACGLAAISTVACGGLTIKPTH